MNVYDSGIIAGYFASRGYTNTDNIADADVIVINTCTVRQHAEERAFSEVGRLKFWKNKKPGRIIVVTGCAAARVGVKQIKHKYPHIGLVVPAKDILRFGKLFDDLLENGRGEDIVGTPLSDDSHPLYPPDKTILQNDKPRVSAFVAISRGCNNYCSYCIVPYVRGEEVPRDSSEVLDEVGKLVKAGIKEIVLLGQNVNSYKSGNMSFANLLTKINDIPNLERIRFLTSHPKDLSDDTIECFKTLPKLCEHIHLALQSGSNRILELMNRKYGIEHYHELINKLRDTQPKIAVTTDLIVGFPGETEDEFEQTVTAVKSIGFDYAYVFKYSPRVGTAAEKWGDTVPQEIKERRHAKLLRVVNNVAELKSKSYVGKIQEVLVDNCNPDTGKCNGKTRAMCSVIFRPESSIAAGHVVKLNIVCNHIHSLEGDLTF